jgi:hypothetical protein
VTARVFAAGYFKRGHISNLNATNSPSFFVPLSPQWRQLKRRVIHAPSGGWGSMGLQEALPNQ